MPPAWAGRGWLPNNNLLQFVSVTDGADEVGGKDSRWFAPFRPEMSEFTGRSAELEQLQQAVDLRRLTVIVGPAGVGKTSLARAALQGRQGVAWCALTDISEVAEALAALASMLGAEVNTPDAEELVATLADRLASEGAPSSIVLDDAEQVVEALPTYLEYLRETTGVVFVLTTRRALRALNAECIELAPLPTVEATHLLLALASRHGAAGLALEDVRGLAERLEGSPLALTLIAPKLVLHSPSELSAQLDAEEPILRRALRRSWQLLSDRERETLSACTVFDEGFSLAAARQVAAPAAAESVVESSLAALLRDSLLLSQRQVELSGELRFRMPRAVRDFARELCSDQTTFERRHAEFCLEVGERCVDAIESAAEAEATTRLRTELPNLKRALGRVDAAVEPLLWVRLALVVHLAQQRRGSLTEQARLTDAAIERARELAPEWLAKALLARSRVARWQHEPERARSLLDAALVEARKTDDPVLVAAILRNAASTALQRNDLDAAADVLAAALREAERSGRLVDQVNARNGLAYLRMQHGEYVAAERELRLAEQAAGRSEIPGLGALVAAALAELMMMTARATEAEHQLGVAIGHYRQLHYRRQLANAHLQRARVRCFGVLPGADEDISDAEVLAGSLGLRVLLGEVAFGRGLAAIAKGRDELALTHLQDALPLLPEPRAKTAMLYCALVHALAARNDAARPWVEAAMGGAGTAAGRVGSTDIDVVLAAAVRGGPWPLEASSAGCLEVQWVHTLLQTRRRAAPGASASDEARLVVSRDERHFIISTDTALDLTRRRALRGVLLCLCERRLATPGKPVSVPELLEAGWPGERMLFDSGARRLYVTINRLRNLGLGNLVLTVGDGYMIAPGVNVVREGA